jgi:hypothetical protein
MFVTLTLNPSPRAGEGLQSGSPSPHLGEGVGGGGQICKGDMLLSIVLRS